MSGKVWFIVETDDDGEEAPQRMKPCPFCGETPDPDDPATFGLVDGGSKWGAVRCCISGPEVRTGYGEVDEWKEDAIAAWNRRAGE